MERVKLISQVSMRPVTEPQTLPRQRVTERERPPHEAIGPSVLVALKNALNAQQTPRQRIVVRRLLTLTYREVFLDF